MTNPIRGLRYCYCLILSQSRLHIKHVCILDMSFITEHIKKYILAENIGNTLLYIERF